MPFICIYPKGNGEGAASLKVAPLVFRAVRPLVFFGHPFLGELQTTAL